MKRIPLTLSMLAIVGTLLTAMAVTLPARASDRKSAATTEQPWLPIPQIEVPWLRANGATYEVRATDRQGARVRLDVHPQTGAILERGARRQVQDRTDSRQRPSASCNERRCRDDMPPKAATP